MNRAGAAMRPPFSDPKNHRMRPDSGLELGLPHRLNHPRKTDHPNDQERRLPLFQRYIPARRHPVPVSIASDARLQHKNAAHRLSLPDRLRSVSVVPLAATEPAACATAEPEAGIAGRGHPQDHAHSSQGSRVSGIPHYTPLSNANFISPLIPSTSSFFLRDEDVFAAVL